MKLISSFFLLVVSACSPQKESTQSDTGTAWSWDETKTINENCFPDVGSSVESFPSYDRFNPTVGHHCAGTRHQKIEDVEKLVFLGDSITKGTWPTPDEEFYRHQLTQKIEERFGSIEVMDCSEFGARTDDFLEHEERQITECFEALTNGTGVEDKKTLVIWTMGGNDLLALGDLHNAGGTQQELLDVLDGIIEYHREAIHFFTEQEASLFPAGVDVVFANNYEFTDGSGDFASCPTAETLGLDFEVSNWATGYLTINEAYMEMAVESQTDMVFMMEHFCGHGFQSENPEGGCYKGPDTEVYFDGTCIHPTPAGHTALANLLDAVIGG